MINNVWQQAIDDELISAHLGVAGDYATLDDARQALSDLIQWHIDVATDPKVNGGRELVKCEDGPANEEDFEGL